MKPPKPAPKYTHIKRGYCGEMGHSGDLTVRYIQSGITIDDLDYLTLVDKIPESHHWNISDLLQRQIDYERVEKQIVPYLIDESKVKFFNPLTLVILPKAGISRIEATPPCLTETEITENEYKYHVVEYPDIFALRVYREEPAYSSIQWNHERCFLLAIDGQHRIAALRLAKQEQRALPLIQDWQIPVVILIIYRKKDTKTDTLIEVTRKTFIYINQKAEKVNEARNIILNDESINSLATQEFIQTLHENDLKPTGQRNPRLPPLYWIDWRGDREKTKRRPYLLNNTEIKDWFDYYLIGEDDSPKQKSILQLNNLDPIIQNGAQLTLEESRKMRQILRADIIPALVSVFENFTPFQKLVTEWRQIEEKESSVTANLLFQELRYGTQEFGDLPSENVKQEREALLDQLEGCKDKIDDTALKDIGLRAIIYAFGKLKEYFDNIEQKFVDWQKFAAGFIKGINQVYADGWFKSWDQLKTEQKKLLTFIAYDDGGNVENYRIADVPNGFGAFIALLTAEKICKQGSSEEKELFDDIWQELSEALPKAMRKGYNRRHKGELADKAMSVKERGKEVKKKTDKAIEAHLEKIAKLVGTTY
jgi:hypothetical protein